MREWMKGIPEKLKEHQEQIDKAMDDYELIEEFFYNLSQDDFNAKYDYCLSSKFINNVSLVYTAVCSWDTLLFFPLCCFIRKVLANQCVTDVRRCLHHLFQ